MVKAQAQKRKIDRILQSCNNVLKSFPSDIAEVFSAYYQTQFNLCLDPNTLQPTQAIIDFFLDSMHLPKLTTEQLYSISSPFTEIELSAVITSLLAHKSPGAGGFTNEFYKKSPQLLTPLLLPLFNQAVSSASFPDEMLQAFIVTIPKLEKDPEHTGNYRPIPF